MRTRFEAPARRLARAAGLHPVRAASGDRRLAQQRRSTRHQRRSDMVAFKGATWMALGATAPILRRSCGYVAVNDGWTDLHDNLHDGLAVRRGLRRQHRHDRADRFVSRADSRSVWRSATRGIAPSRTCSSPVPSRSRRRLNDFRDEWSRTARRFALAASLRGSRGLCVLRAQRQPAAGARGQELPRRDDCRAEHSLGQLER